MNKDIKNNLIWAAIMLPLAFAAALAFKHGYITADTKTRVVAMTGLWIAWYGNQLPKTVVPHAGASKARRVAGWAMVLSGLVYAGLFVFAPIPVAVRVGTAAILLGIAGTFAYCLTLREARS